MTRLLAAVLWLVLAPAVALACPGCVASPYGDRTFGWAYLILYAAPFFVASAIAGVLAYCVSKAAVDQLTRCAALELAPLGVRVNAVNPGVTVTNLHRRGGMGDEQYAAFLERSKSTHPLGRPGRPEEVASLILYLASESAEWMTGETIPIDGGRHLTCLR